MLKDPHVIKLDVRDVDEWLGHKVSPIAEQMPLMHTGRIPGAVWIPWRSFLTSDSNGVSHFKSSQEISVTDRTILLLNFKGSSLLIENCFY